MRARNRPLPTIPDHDVLRVIGGGAYGEVWLARGVTGALRAVKVVWREDFDGEKSFEREFEGILKFEPISREHPGFVNILHVGRSADGKSFYYYVMELGDDVRCGSDINPIEYEPRTLQAETRGGPGKPWASSDCIDVGLRLAEALGHLHQAGLVHRDVKPANVIFVNGKAKLADIGLVAARGQRTFVGTEGFVPPEGPGTAAADVYSLGKVLYEIATGKDRLNFPDLPEEIPAGEDRKRWLELNRIICETCDPRLIRRKISTAEELAESLKLIQRGKRRHRRGMAAWVTGLLLLGFAGLVAGLVARHGGWRISRTENPPDFQPPKEEIGWVRVVSVPEGAEVFDPSGALIDTTPSKNMTARIGEEAAFTVEKKGYRSKIVREKVLPSALDEAQTIFVALELFRPPEKGQPWEDGFGNSYDPQGPDHYGREFVSTREWKQFTAAKSEKIPVTFAADPEQLRRDIVLCDEAAARKFADWFQAESVKTGYLSEDHEVMAIRDTGFSGRDGKAASENSAPFKLRIRRIPYGTMSLASEPEGAEVYVNGELAGKISSGRLEVPKVKPGEIELLFVREGYKPFSEKFRIGESESITRDVVMEKSKGVVFGKDWENSLGMKFVPLGMELMVSTWETRVRDYAEFTRRTRQPVPRDPGFLQTPEHPVVNVSRVDAEEFCKWLTGLERSNDRINLHMEYRLPTDAEWSMMAGFSEEADTSPAWRFARETPGFPWGREWDGREITGNFSDASAREAGAAEDRVLPGYDDGFPFTAPVGSFPPAAAGIHDLGGNVQEWVSDDYSKYNQAKLGTLRGGAWNTYQVDSLRTGFRGAMPPEFMDRMYGFRVVLAKIPPLAEESTN